MLEEALRTYEDTPKLHLMAGQIAEQQNDYAKARRYYQEGVRKHPQCIPLWISLSRLLVSFVFYFQRSYYADLRKRQAM